MSIREHPAGPVVVRCLSCRAAVDKSVADDCPFCGTDLASMPLIEAAPTEVIEPAVTPRSPKPRRRSGAVAAVFVTAAVLAALGASDARPTAVAEAPETLPSVAIPLVTGRPAHSTPPVRSPAPSSSPAAAAAAKPAVAGPQGCDFFTTRELDGEYAFERARADLQLQRARENNEHRFRIDHDAAAHKTRAEAAAADHARAIAAIDRRMSAARAACDPQLLF